MKNFSEATAIKPGLKLSVSLILTPVGKLPCLVKFNNSILFENTLVGSTVINHELGLEDSLDLSIQIHRHHPDAVLVSLSVDGIEILPTYLHLANPPTNYLDRPGTWTFKIPSFYPWYHEITGQGWVA